MKNERNQYSEAVNVCSLIIGGALFYLGLNALILRPLIWEVQVQWFGFIWLAIGAVSLLVQLAAWVNRDKLRNKVLYEYEVQPTATIEEISKKTGITEKDVTAIVLDLKASGILRGKFSSSTVEMKYVEITTSTPSESTEGKVIYCPNCGTAKSKELLSPRNKQSSLKSGNMIKIIICEVQTIPIALEMRNFLE